MTAPTARRLASGMIELHGVRYGEDGHLFGPADVVYEMVQDRRWIVVKPARRNPKAWQVHNLYVQHESAAEAAGMIEGSVIIEVRE